MASGVIFPPIKAVYDKTRDRYMLLDGHHRLEARKLLGETTVLVLIEDVLELYWELHAAAHNLKNSAPLDEEDQKQVILRAFTRKIPVADIAERLGYTVSYINKVVKPLRDEERHNHKQNVMELAKKGLPQHAIVEQTGLDKFKVHRLIKAAQQENSKDPSFCCKKGISPTLQQSNSLDLSTASPLPTPDPAVEVENQNPPPAIPVPDPEAAEKKRNAEIVQLAYEMGTPDANAPEAIAKALGIHRPGNRFPGLNLEIPKPAPSLDKALPPEQMRQQAEVQFSTGVPEIDGYEDCPEKDRKALRIMELVKMYDQDIDVICTAVEEPADWVKGVMIAAIIFAVSPSTGDDYTVEIADRLGMSYELAETIADFPKHYKLMLLPIAPHMPAWLERNIPDEYVAGMLKILDMNRLDFHYYIVGKPVPTSTSPDLPQEEIETLRTAVLLFRKFRDKIRSGTYSDKSLIAAKKWVAKMQIVLNEIVQTEKLSIGTEDLEEISDEGENF